MSFPAWYKLRTADPPPGQAATAKGDQIDRVRFGDRWLMDNWEMFPVPAGFGLLLVDMSQAQKAIRILRDAHIPATYPHLLVRALGMAFSYNPGRLQLVCNYRRLIAASLNIGLSMSGQTSYAPVVVIPEVEKKPLSVLIPEIIQSVDTMGAREATDIAAVRRWVVPFRFLRRWLLSILNRSLEFRTRLVGNYQVTCVNNADIAVPFLFYSSAIMSMGAVRDRVVVVDGKPAVRPTVWLAGVCDHVAVDGQTGGDALYYIKFILESELLVREAEETAALKAKQVDGSTEPRLAAGSPPPAAGARDDAT
jgi:hypothetical protein